MGTMGFAFTALLLAAVPRVAYADDEIKVGGSESVTFEVWYEDGKVRFRKPDGREITGTRSVEGDLPFIAFNGSVQTTRKPITMTCDLLKFPEDGDVGLVPSLKNRKIKCRYAGGGEVTINTSKDVGPSIPLPRALGSLQAFMGSSISETNGGYLRRTGEVEFTGRTYDRKHMTTIEYLIGNDNLGIEGHGELLSYAAMIVYENRLKARFGEAEATLNECLSEKAFEEQKKKLIEAVKTDVKDSMAWHLRGNFRKGDYFTPIEVEDTGDALRTAYFTFLWEIRKGRDPLENPNFARIFENAKQFEGKCKTLDLMRLARNLAVHTHNLQNGELLQKYAATEPRFDTDTQHFWARNQREIDGRFSAITDGKDHAKVTQTYLQGWDSGEKISGILGCLDGISDDNQEKWDDGFRRTLARQFIFPQKKSPTAVDPGPSLPCPERLFQTFLKQKQLGKSPAKVLEYWFRVPELRKKLVEQMKDFKKARLLCSAFNYAAIDPEIIHRIADRTNENSLHYGGNRLYQLGGFLRDLDDGWTGAKGDPINALYRQLNHVFTMGTGSHSQQCFEIIRHFSADKKTASKKTQFPLACSAAEAKEALRIGCEKVKGAKYDPKADSCECGGSTYGYVALQLWKKCDAAELARVCNEGVNEDPCDPENATAPCTFLRGASGAHGGEFRMTKKKDPDDFHAECEWFCGGSKPSMVTSQDIRKNRCQMVAFELKTNQCDSQVAIRRHQTTGGNHEK